MRAVFQLVVAGSFCWFLISSLWVYPHSLSYFNESVGGPLNGPKHLLGSNVDWGQDLRYLQERVKAVPDLPEVVFCAESGLSLASQVLGQRKIVLAPAVESQQGTGAGKRTLIAISVSVLNSQHAGSFPAFGGVRSIDTSVVRDAEKLGYVGYSIILYLSRQQIDSPL